MPTTNARKSAMSSCLLLMTPGFNLMPIASFADASSAGVLDTEHHLCHLVVGHATTGTTRDARIASVPRARSALSAGKEFWGVRVKAPHRSTASALLSRTEPHERLVSQASPGLSARQCSPSLGRAGSARLPGPALVLRRALGGGRPLCARGPRCGGGAGG